MLVNKKILSRLTWIVLGFIMLTPIYVNSDLFFPYITSKALAFRVLVEVLLLLWLAWLWISKNKIKIDWLTIVFFVFLLMMLVSSIFGLNFYFSFWSNLERSEGILLWLHLFVLFLVLRNFIDSRQKWRILMDMFFIAAQIVAVLGLLQYFGADFVNNAATVNERISSTIGNAAYLAGYMLFAIFFGIYLFIKRKNRYLKLGYLVAILIDIFVMVQTGTRGALVAFLGTIFLFIIYNLFTQHHFMHTQSGAGFILKNKKVKYSLLAVGLILLLSLGYVYNNRNSDWVQDNLPLRRLTSISLSERTAETRLMAWNAAWQGFLERPILGWGQENYYIVFNKYFNPEIYSHAGSRVWFDRAHNIFLDRLVNSGVIGLILYILMLAIPAWAIFKKGVLVKVQEGVKKDFGNQILLLAIIAFVIQGLVVFEAMVTYLPLLIILALISQKYLPVKYEIGGKNLLLVSLIVYLMAFGPAIYYFNYREAKASATMIDAMRLQNVDYDQSIKIYFESIEANTSGRNEFRRRVAEFIDGLVVNRTIGPYEAGEYVNKLDNELLMRLEENPYDAANLMLMMRHYNYTYVLDYNRLFEVKKIGDLLYVLSPTRPQLYYELGYADLYLYLHYKDQGDQETAQQYQRLAKENFDIAINLNNDVRESYINMIMVLLASDQPEQVQNYVDIMDEMNLRYRDDVSALRRMFNSAINAGHFEWAIKFIQLAIEQEPTNPQNYIDLALAYVNLERDEEAIATAEQIKQFGSQYEAQVDEFINQVRNGTFVKQYTQ